MASGTIVKIFQKGGLICSSDGEKTYFFSGNNVDFDYIVGLKVNFVPEITEDDGYDHATEINTDGELDIENLEYLKKKHKERYKNKRKQKQARQASLEADKEKVEQNNNTLENPNFQYAEEKGNWHVELNDLLKCQKITLRHPDSNEILETYRNVNDSKFQKMYAPRPSIIKLVKESFKNEVKKQTTLRRIVNSQRDVHLVVPFEIIIGEIQNDLDWKRNLDNGEKVIIVGFTDRIRQTIPTRAMRENFLDSYLPSYCIEYVDKVDTRFFEEYIRSYVECIWIVSPVIFRCTGYTLNNSRCKNKTNSSNLRCFRHQINFDEEYNEQKIKNSLKYCIHEELLRKRIKNNTWIIVGDETGPCTEFYGHETYTKSGMSWIVIPPNSNIKPLPIGFHATSKDIDGPEYRRFAQEQLVSNNDVLRYYFPYESSEFLKDRYSKIGKDPHLSFWRHSLPLVLESISSKIGKNEQINIYVEQVAVLKPREGIFASETNDIVDYRAESNRSVIRFGETWILSKGSHPFIGYPDALGHVFKENAFSDEDNYSFQIKEEDNSEFRSNISILRESTCIIPYQERTLKKISNCLKISNPLQYLRQITDDFLVDELSEFVVPHLEECTINSISRMSQEEWREYLEYIRQIGNDDYHKQRSIRFCFSCVKNHDFIAENKIDNDLIRFEFWMAVLGNTNHTANTNFAEECINKIQSLLDSQIPVSSDRKLDFENHKLGNSLNKFDFNKLNSAIGIMEQYIDQVGENPTESLVKFFGTLALGLGLRNTNEDIQRAIKLEKIISESSIVKTQKPANIKRRRTLLSELYLTSDNSEYIAEALQRVKKDIVDSSFNTEKSSIKEDPYFLALLLKASVLNEDTSEINLQEILSHKSYHHPWNRICYWALRYLEMCGLTETEEFEICINHIKELSYFESSKHNVFGVILSSFMLDIEYRFGILMGAVKYRNDVYDNELTSESIREWLSEFNEYPLTNVPENPLAPLNHNYC